MINRVNSIGPVPPQGNGDKLQRIASDFENEITGYVAAFLNLNPTNLEAQLSNMANRTVALYQKAKEAQTYVK